MEAIDAQLEAAEFEAIWLQVRYHEGRATVPEVEEAIRRVNELRLIAHELAGLRSTGTVFPYAEPAPSVPVGN